MTEYLSAGDLANLDSLVQSGNYTQFYYELYQSGSTIAGLYIPGPTGHGVFGNYSHEFVREVIGEENFDTNRERISRAIAEGLLEMIEGNLTPDGQYRVPTDVEFLTREIYIFTDVLGYPSSAYPGHDLITVTMLDVDGAVFQWDILTRVLHYAEAEFHASGETHYRYNGEWLTVDELRAIPNSGLNIIGAFIYNSSGALLETSVGVFEYKGVRYARSDLIEQDGVYFVNTAEFGLIPVGLTRTTVATMIYQLTDSCFLSGTMIEMWPAGLPLDPDAVGCYDDALLRGKVWRKPIEEIEPDDIVVSFDTAGNLQPGRVTRIFRNSSKIVLDYFGTGVTPGHVYYRADSDKPRKFETLIDILRDDGVIQLLDGTQIRAATGVPIGDPRDGFVCAVTGPAAPDGQGVEVRQSGRIRLGTRVITDDGRDFCIYDLIQAQGGSITEDGLIEIAGAVLPFHWIFGNALPKPEDYILQRSGTTLDDIYRAGEWESQRPHMPTPQMPSGNAVAPLAPHELSMMPRNTPPAMQDGAHGGKFRPDAGQADRKKSRQTTEQRIRAANPWPLH